MKKILLILFVLCIFLCAGCSKKVSITSPEKIDVYIDEEIKLDLVLENITIEELVFDVEDGLIVKCENGEITGLKEGETNIMISDSDKKVAKTVTVTVTPKPVILFDDSIRFVKVNEELQLNVTTENYNGDIIYSSSDETIATVSQTGVVKGIKAGEVTINARCGRVSESLEILVGEDIPIVISGNNSCYIGEKLSLSCELIHISGDVEWSVSDTEIATIDNNGVLKGLAEGNVTVFVSCNGYTAEYRVTVFKDTSRPVITCEGEKNITVGFGTNADLLVGLVATDNIDGDITSKITVEGTFDNRKYGKQSVRFNVTDSSGNVGAFIRQVTVEWQYAVNFIGHAGCYYGLMNSEEAFLYAATVLKYQYIECDIKQTSDGVFVMCHDDTFGGYTLASTPWSTLQNVEVTKGRNGGIPSQNGSVVKDKYTAKLCTLARFLEICRENNVIPVIELKSSKGITNSDQSRMQALMDEIGRCGMLNKCVLLGSQYNCLIWTRQNGYDYIPCQYLVNSCESNTVLNRCIDYNLDVSINVTASYSNSDEWLAKYKEKGIKISTYTFTQYVDYPVVQEWIDKGVDFVTVDWHIMDKLNLPMGEDPNLPKYKVTFKDKEGNVLKVSEVKQGHTAAAPDAPLVDGYEFAGWGKELTNITTDTEFVAQYEIIEYLIDYNANNIKKEEVSWENKQAFVDEFYGDLYNWFCNNSSNISGLTNNNGSFTFSRNGVTVKFANSDDIKAINIYDFEKTISNIIYKEVERQSDGSCIIYEDENFFLNSKAYLEKYSDLDRWFYECCVNNYSAYNRTYKILSDGRIQIMFRFQQWQQGTSISSFNKLPVKYVVNEKEGINPVLPEGPNSYTILDNVALPVATGDKKFLGWTLTPEGTEYVTEIKAGSTGNILLYAQWEE